jgi:ankyrin repeat protein
MKRSSDAIDPSGHSKTFINTANDLRTSQQPAPSATPNGTAATIQPSIASMTNRTGGTMLPAALPPVHTQPADSTSATKYELTEPFVWPIPAHPSAFKTISTPARPGSTAPAFVQAATATDSPAGNEVSQDIFQNKIWSSQVMSKLSHGHTSWQRDLDLLKGQERTNFLITSLLWIAMDKGSARHWSVIADRIIDELGTTILFTQKWPGKLTWTHLAACLKNTKWLNLALATETGKMSLILKNSAGQTPLHMASRFGIKKAVHSILGCDDDTGSLRMEQTNGKHIALHEACVNNHVSAALLLLGLKGREQRMSATTNGCLPIHEALQHGANIDVLPHLLAECAREQTLAKTGLGMNALMFAAKAASVDAVDMLLAVEGSLAAQLEARDSEGLAAIDHARRSGNAGVIARIDAAMQTLQPSSASTTTNTTSTTATPAALPANNRGPIPLMPYPPTPAVEDKTDLSDTEVELDM